MQEIGVRDMNVLQSARREVQNSQISMLQSSCTAVHA